LPGYTSLKPDGSTACGCWIYCGCYANETNQTACRKPWTEQTWVAPEWAWPMNRRILYNRASADPEGKPWSEGKKYIWWDEEEGKWTGYGEPDFPMTRRPDYAPPEGARRGRDPGRQAVHNAGGRHRLALRSRRPHRRSSPDPLRAARVPFLQPPLHSEGEPGAQRVSQARQSLQPFGRPSGGGSSPTSSRRIGSPSITRRAV
jgi:hypothetical protein